MSENNVLYDVLSERVEMLADSFDDNVPYHKFSRGYMRKEKEILKAYLKSQEKRESIDLAYNSIKRGNRIKFAVIVVIAALFLAGFTIYITHYFGNLQINEYDTHSFAFALDSNNAPETLERRYLLNYDLSEWNKEIMDNDQYDYWETYKLEDKYIGFAYHTKSSYKNIRYNTENSTVDVITIEGRDYIFYVSPTGLNCLTWDNEDCIMELFYKGISNEEAEEIISSIIVQ